jgi:glycerate kinase
MRIVVAPDEFKGSLTAPAAARAIADGWSRTAPDDVIDLCPLSDGGPGFVDTLAAALGGELISATVAGPLGQPVPAAVLLVDDTVYLESAQACGVHLLGPHERDPRVTTSYGVGEMLKLAVSLHPKKIVVGLGGSGTNDGGAGLLAALGATADAPLDAGGAALAKLTSIDIRPARAALGDVELVAATDVDNPLLGLTGASKTFGPQKGADDNTVLVLDAALEIFARAIGRRPDGKDPAVALGAGAAGGLGYSLLQLGAKRAPGIATVLAATDFEARVRASDLVVTGEGCFDWQSMRGKVVSGVATMTMPTARPCIVIAGDVLVGRREYSALGISGAYPVAEFAGSVSESLADPAHWLQTASARVARTWSR